jgi:prophage regulatory protein
LHFSGPTGTTAHQVSGQDITIELEKDIDMTPQILRRKDVEATVGLSRSTIYYLISEGLFPAPIKLGKRAVGWKVSDIETWVNDRTST